MSEQQTSNGSTQTSTELYSPLSLGRYEIPNRVTMAALTRSRAGESGVPTELHTEYYSQRAGNGLVVTEGTFPEVTAGLSLDKRELKQLSSNRGGVKLRMQFTKGWHDLHADHARWPLVPRDVDRGVPPEAPSAIASGTAVRDFEARKPCPVPRALETEEIPRVIEQFRAAARRAVDAGWTAWRSTEPTDTCCTSFWDLNPTSAPIITVGPENRARLLVEILRAVAKEIGADRLGVRLSPRNNIQGVVDGDDAEALASYSVLLDEVAQLGLAYVSFLYPHPEDDFIADLRQKVRANGKTKVIFNTGFAEVTQREDAIEQMSRENVDAVAIGRMVIANPDLSYRWENDLALNEPDPDTFYVGGARGYTDYPFAD